MRVFISWSGLQSKQIANTISTWLPLVIQAVRPYYSPDIPKGKRWAADIAQVLEESKVGIIVLTRDNTGSPWINFEAGALSKEIAESSVCPILFGIEPTEISGPLAQFQASRFNKEEFRKVVSSINVALGQNALSDSMLNSVYEKWWPDLEERIQQILAQGPAIGVANDTDNNLALLGEIREIKRQNYELASTVAELRGAIFPNIPASIPNEARHLSGIWIDTVFADERKYSGVLGKYLVFAYETYWPGIYFGIVRDGIYRFSWMRFDNTLSGKGYLRVKEAGTQMEGGIWFDDRDIDSMLARDTFLEHHVLLRESKGIDHHGEKLLQKARDFLLSKGFLPDA